MGVVDVAAVVIAVVVAVVVVVVDAGYVGGRARLNYPPLA